MMGYMLLCSFEVDAEATCERHLALAGSLDPSDPEVYQVRISAMVLSFKRGLEASELTVLLSTDTRFRSTESTEAG